MSRRSKSARRTTTVVRSQPRVSSVSTTVKSRTKRSGRNSVSRARVGTATAAGMFPATRNFQKAELGAVITNPRFPTKRSQRRVNSGGAKLPPIVASYIDPFDEEAGGVRYPDEFRGMTGTVTSTFVSTMLTPPAAFTDANLAAVSTSRKDTTLFLVTPDPTNVVVQGLCGTPNAGLFNGQAGTFIWPNGIVFTDVAGTQNVFGPSTGNQTLDNMMSNIAPFMSTYSTARLVSGGVKLFSTSSFSNVSGTIHLAPVYLDFSRFVNSGLGILGGGSVAPATGQYNNSWQAQLPASLAEMAQLPGYTQFALASLEEDEIAALFKRVGEEALLFKGTGAAWMIEGTAPESRIGASTAPSGYGHMSILCFVDGFIPTTGVANDLPVLELEVRNHYETTFKGSSTMRVSSTLSVGAVTVVDGKQAAPHQPLLMAAADNLAADVPAIRLVDSAGVEESSFIQDVSNAWSSATRIASSVAGAIDIAGGLLAALVL